MSSRLTEVLKKLHGKSFSSLPFNTNVAGINLDSIFPPTDGDVSSHTDASPNIMELVEQEVPPIEAEEKVDDEPHGENDVARSEGSVLSEKDEQKCEGEEEENGKDSVETTSIDDLEKELQDDVENVKNDFMKAPTDESNKRSRRKQQKTHKCVALDDSLLGSPTSDLRRSSVEGCPHKVDQLESPENAAKIDLESLFDLPEGTVFVQPESVENSPKVISLETSRSKKIFKGGSLESAILHCTACNKQLGVDGLMDYHRHPMLKVLVCRKCYNWYISGEIDQDKDGTDEQCRWCRQGGDLICCDFCHNSFCKSCVRRNLGRKELSSILDTEDDFKWKCYVCDPKRLLGLIEHCSGVMEALAKQEKKQQEMDLKRKKNVKLSQVVMSTIAAVRPSNSVSMTTNSCSTVAAQLQQHQQQNDEQKSLNLKQSDAIRRISDGRIEPRYIQPKPANLNHSFHTLSSLTPTDLSSRPSTSTTDNDDDMGTSMNSTYARPLTIASILSTGSENNLKDLVVVENLISLTSNMESMLIGLLKESKKVTANNISTPPTKMTNSLEATPTLNSESTVNNADSKLEAITRKLFKAQNLYLDSYRIVAEINATKTATSSKTPAVSILANQNKIHRSNAPTLVKDQNGKLVLVSKVASQSKPGTNKLQISGNQTWLAKNLTQSIAKVTLPQVIGQATQVQLASSKGKPTRTVIRIKPSSSAAAAAAIASGTIPLIVNDSKGHQKVVLAPIMVKPVAPKPPVPIPVVIKPAAKPEEVLVISDTEEDGERTATVNLPEIIIHDVVVEDGVSIQKQTGNSTTSKTNNQQVLTDKFLNQKEVNSTKKDEDSKISFKQKRKKENDDDFATDHQSKKLKEDVVVKLKEDVVVKLKEDVVVKLKEDVVVASSPKKNHKEKTSSTQSSHLKIVASTQDFVESKTTSERKDASPPKVTHSEKKSEKLESKSQNPPSENDPKTPEPINSQSEVKVPKKRGRKRKEKGEIEVTTSHSKQPKFEEVSNTNLRRSSRRCSLPVVELNDAELNKAACKQTNVETQVSKVMESSSKEVNNPEISNKESNNDVRNHGNKKSQKKEDISPKSSSIRTRRSCASIPDSQSDGAVPRVTRATTNRKSLGC